MSLFANTLPVSVTASDTGPALIAGPGPDMSAGAPLVFIFSEPIRLGSGTFSIEGPAGIVYSGAIGATLGLTVSGATLAVAGYPVLAYGTVYHVVFGAGAIRDLDGNPANASQPIDFGFRSALSPVPVNLAGTAGDDLLTGSELADVIDGAGGADTIYGAGGDDTLRGGAGDDTVYGQDGNDLLEGGAGSDQMYGDAGDDKLYGGTGDDWLYGGFGNDELHGGAGNDVLDDPEGDSLMYGDDGDDELSVRSGGRPGDTSGSHRLYGGNGDDRITLAAGTGLLDGGDGNDSLTVTVYGASASGVIEVRGGAGDDVVSIGLYGGAVDVVAEGGAGSDVFRLFEAPRGGSITITDFTAGRGGDVLSLTELAATVGANPFAGGGNLRLVQRGADTVLQQRPAADAGFSDVLILKNVDRAALTVDNFAGYLNPDGSQHGLDRTGTGGDDRIDGGWLDDRLQGAGGNDVLAGGAGDDVLLGGAGDDILDGDGMANGAPYPGLLPFDSSVSSDDRLEGGDGNDVLTSFWGNDTLLGGAGRDRLTLDMVLTTSQPVFHSTLDGGDGDDHLRIGRNFDGVSSVELTGGAGSDLFSIDSVAGKGSLTILDFQAGAGGDVLDVFDLAPLSLVTQFNASYFRFLQRGADTVVQVDFDRGDSTYDFQDVVTLKNVASNTLVAENMRYGYLPGAAIPAGQRYDGTDGADRLQGGIGNDHLAGGAGNDFLIGGGGSNVLDGGRGLDTVLYTGTRADYEISFAADGKWVDDKRGGLQGGRDALFNVERLEFADGALALDIGNSGVAAQTYRLYRAAFDRVPDEGGLGFWISRIDAGVDLRTVASEFVRSAEFRDLYGAAPDNAAVLRELYLNVFDREPDEGGFAFWLDVLNSGRAPLAEVLLEFSGSAENIGATVDLIAEGIPYQPYIG